MKPVLRDPAFGALAGLTGGLLLIAIRLEPGTAVTGLLDVGPIGAELAAHLGLSIALGAGLAAVVRHQARAYAATISSGLLLGLLWWLAGSLTLTPLVNGEGPTWDLSEATAAFPSLIGDLLFGGLTGILLAVLAGLRPPASEQRAVATVPETRVVILGGGFGGVSTAQRLERLFARDPTVETTLVSTSNYLLFTPMLAEVASSALEARHISSPVRAMCPRTRFHRAEVTEIDTEAQTVRLATGQELAYDHLVLALGAVPDYRGLTGVEENSFALKSLGDATELRNHVIGQLERADTELDGEERRRLLTFVVAGGGFAGTEMIAELFDLVHIVLRYYPRIEPEELRFVLVHSRDRILPEIGAELAGYALDKLRARGIEFALETRVAGATPDAILLDGGRSVPTRTIVWTAGNQPNPLLAQLPYDRSRSGSAVLVESTLQLGEHPAIWAVGDCARIPAPGAAGDWYPPTAQHALREGKAVADNIAALLRGREPKPFHFEAIGSLVALGHRTAVAEIRGRRFSGAAAWLLWRGVYWSKLPGLEKKLRVLLDWTIDLYFPRDIVLTSVHKPQGAREGEDAGDRDLARRVTNA